MAGEHVAEHTHVVRDGDGRAFGDIDVSVAAAEAPEQRLPLVDAVTGNNGCAYGIVGAGAAADGDGWIAVISQTEIQLIDNRYIEHIRGRGIAAGSQCYRVAHDLSGARRSRVCALDDCCNIRLNDINRHDAAGQCRLCRSSRAVGIRVGDHVVDSIALLGAHYVAHPGMQLDHRLLAGRDLGD